ncbi:MAG: polysaccharide deacetylase family protein [Candidatus Omnitrophica bacterium]|nr:polysaccharide deacetylase family protein [Candidatus Omnitrophota bacterium]
MKRRDFLSSTVTLTAAGLFSSQAFARDEQTKGFTWKDGKKWVYSITYDEGVIDLFKYAIPLHRKYEIPGHLAIVTDQIGKVRILPGSSYHGFSIMDKDQIKSLVDESWGVSCHSMSHCGVTVENAQVEVVEAKAKMEEILEMPITIFTVPGSNHGHAPSLLVAEDAGYNAIMTIYDRVNTIDTDLMWLGRIPLHTEYPGPFYTRFDPYKGFLLASKVGGWVIDYNHCPMPNKPVHPAKDVTSEELEQRFQALKEFGGDDVWIADCNEVVDYLLNHPAAQQVRSNAPDPLDDVYNLEMRQTYSVLKEG